MMKQMDKGEKGEGAPAPHEAVSYKKAQYDLM